jgi:hypothetical protein
LDTLQPSRPLALAALSTHGLVEDVAKNALYCLGNLAKDPG